MAKAILMGLVLMLTPCILWADNILACSGATVRIDFVKSSTDKYALETVVQVSRGNRSTVLRYDGGIDYIGAECRKNRDNKSYIVFQAYCGGSGCKDLANYGMIDPKDLRVLLVPNDWNHKDAEKIFEGKITPIKLKLLLSVEDAARKLGIPPG
jgi:hypothetical protein